MIRAFLAVELPDELRAQIAAVQQDLKQRLSRECSRDVRISWVQPASIHLTVKFLGDTDESLVEPMRAALDRVAQGHRAMSIPLDRIGAFPRPQQPRIVWVGPAEAWEDRKSTRLNSSHRT